MAAKKKTKNNLILLEKNHNININDEDEEEQEEQVENEMNGKNKTNVELATKSNKPTITTNAASSSSTTTTAQKNSDLSQNLTRLLSHEPTSIHSTSLQSINNPNLSQIPINSSNSTELSNQVSSLFDQRVKILDEKLKLYQSQITQLRIELDQKNQIIDEFQKFQRSESENLLEKFKSIAESKFSANDKLVKSQSAELKENRAIIKELNSKISQIYSGEEKSNRIKLETQVKELTHSNEQLKSSLDNQRRRRKEAEREAARAHSAAQEAVKDRLKEANDEVETLKKMLDAETTNSKGLINQVNQLRSNNPNNTSGTLSHQRNINNNSSMNPVTISSNSSNDKIIEDLKTRASIIADFTGFVVLNSSVDNKGSIYDCMVTDIVSRGFALTFKLQYHSDQTCSYFPSLNQERDASTIKVLPEFLRAFIRFQKEASAHVFWKLFQSFNF